MVEEHAVALELGPVAAAQAIVEIAKQDNFDLILHEGVIYAGNKVDITDKVIKAKPAQITGVMKAYLDGLAYMKAKPAEANAIINAQRIRSEQFNQTVNERPIGPYF